jgi:hypothetical protein
MLRVVFSRIGKPHIGSPQAFLFNIPSVTGGGGIKIDRGAGVTESRSFTLAGGMCPRCEGMGNAKDIDLTQLYDETKSLAKGAITVPGYTADGWSTRMFSESGFLDPDKPIRDYTKTELHDFLHKEPVKVKINGINLTYEGPFPRIQKSFLSKDVDALQPHLRAFVERAVTFTRAPTAAALGSTSRPGRRRSTGSASPTPARRRSATWPSWCATSTNPRWRRCWRRWARASTRSSRWGWAISAWIGPRARSPVARRNGRG